MEIIAGADFGEDYQDIPELLLRDVLERVLLDQVTEELEVDAQEGVFVEFHPDGGDDLLGLQSLVLLENLGDIL